MSSIARAIFVAVHAASFLALTSISPATTTLASPLQASSPANSSSSLLAARVVSKHPDTGLVACIPTSSLAALPLQQRVSSANSTYHKLSVSRDKIQGNAKAMSMSLSLLLSPVLTTISSEELAHQAQSRARSFDDDIVQKADSEMQAYKNNLHELVADIKLCGPDCQGPCQL